MNDLERHELVVRSTNPGNEEQAGISPIDDFGILILEEVAHPRPACKDELRDVLDDLGLLLLRHREEPLRESDLA